MRLGDSAGACLQAEAAGVSLVQGLETQARDGSLQLGRQDFLQKNQPSLGPRTGLPGRAVPSRGAETP